MDHVKTTQRYIIYLTTLKFLIPHIYDKLQKIVCSKFVI